MTLRNKLFCGACSILALIALVVLCSQPKNLRAHPVTVKLWNGQMQLIGTDSGRRLCFDGDGWHRALYKATGLQVPFGNRPSAMKPVYTNGLALRFRHDVSVQAAMSNARYNLWNGSGKMFYVDSGGRETLAWLHTVNFYFNQTNLNIVGEELWFEIPYTREGDLHMRLYETNGVTGLVSTNDFRMLNPTL